MISIPNLSDEFATSLTIQDRRQRRLLERSKKSSSLYLDHLPTELVLEILRLAGSLSQSTFRCLLLTSKRINQLVQLECIPLLPILITKEAQLLSFSSWLRSNQILANQVKYLWLAPDISPSALEYIQMIIVCLALCPNVVSLACNSHDLVIWDLISSDPEFGARHSVIGGAGQEQATTTSLFSWKHLSLKHLTVLEKHHWQPHRDSMLFSQIQTLHVIGCDSWSTFPCTMLHTHSLLNLRDLSFSVPRNLTPNIVQGNLLQSPNLKRIALVVQVQPSQNQLVNSFDPSMRKLLGDRYTLFSRPRRWTETKMWKEKCFDSGCVWGLRRYK
ncbi:hypothetical protein D9757_008464 [Collybiopsis confluens]|uniref:F-box domain-containing protein n=1 Tax=Collybiopsis confluens TaxID=2823264 RepID=A0A8H5HFL1_9AGAR|nr:hypothetical protein D9757_008464 [Collybiopsis confluens]